MFSAGLGGSSLFIDEVYTWHAVRGDMSHLFEALRVSEVTPPLYYLLLDGWLALTGSESEVVMRIPSAAAGVALVGAVYWLGTLVAGRTAGLVASGLTAVNPLTLLYAQQVRAYIWVMLAATLAVAATIHAVRNPAGRRFAVAALAAVLAICTHYTALLVLAPVAGWVVLQRDLDLRWRIGYLVAMLAPLAALAPLALEQLSRGHHESTSDYATLTSFNLLRLFGTPFDGRAGEGMILVREVGALIVVEVLALLAFADRFRRVRHRHVIAAAAALPILVVLVVSAGLVPMALTRYTAVAAPFVLVGIGALVAHAPRAAALTLVGAAVAVSAPSVVAAQMASGQHPDVRGAFETAGDGWKRGDVLVGVSLLGFTGALSYYAERELPRGDRDAHTFSSLQEAVAAPEVFDAAADGRQLWILSDPPMSPGQVTRALIPIGYAAASVQTFEGNAEIQLVRAVPAR